MVEYIFMQFCKLKEKDKFKFWKNTFIAVKDIIN